MGRTITNKLWWLYFLCFMHLAPGPHLFQNGANRTAIRSDKIFYAKRRLLTGNYFADNAFPFQLFQLFDQYPFAHMRELSVDLAEAAVLAREIDQDFRLVFAFYNPDKSFDGTVQHNASNLLFLPNFLNIRYEHFSYQTI